MKKILVVDIDVRELTKTGNDFSEDTGNGSVNELIYQEFGWLNESGIVLQDIYDSPEELINEDSWTEDAKREEEFDAKSDLIEFVATVIEDDFINFEVEKDILYDLLRSVPKRKLIEYLPEDERSRYEV